MRLLALLLLCVSSSLHAADVLHLYNRNNYISDATVARFEAACRCRLVQDYYSDKEEMPAKLAAGASSYDLIVPTGNTIADQVSATSAAQ